MLQNEAQPDSKWRINRFWVLLGLAGVGAQNNTICTNAPQFASYTGTDSSCPWVCNSGFSRSGSSCVSNASLMVQGNCASEVSCSITAGGPSITAITCAGNAMVDYGTTFNGFCAGVDGNGNHIITASPYSNTIGAVVILNISIADGDVGQAYFEYVITSDTSNFAKAQYTGFYFEMAQYLDTYTTNNCPYLQEIPHATGCSSVTVDGTEYDNLFMTFKIPGNAFYQMIDVPENGYGTIIDPNTWFNISYTWEVACAQHQLAPCPRGQYQAACQGGNVGGCTSCAMGAYSNFSGATVCSPCPSATYSNFSGATVCSPCPSGTYSNRTGVTACASCQLCTVAGYYLAGCAGSSAGNCTKCTK